MSQGTKKSRRQFCTSIDKEILGKAELLKALLRAEGQKKDGINELIEEGLELVIDKYSNDLSHYKKVIK